MSITRWGINPIGEWCIYPDGEMVKFEDHEKALVPLTAEIRCLRASNKALDEEYEARRLERDTAIADKRELLTALEVLNDLPIEHDSNGHAFKRIACRSIMDHGAELSALIAKHKEGV